MILSLFRKDPVTDAAAALFQTATAQARLPAFYCDFNVPDTLEGRFELLTLHVFLLLDRLKKIPGGAKTAQAVFDRLFANVDDSLREMGVGDLSVGRKVRAMAEAFYGRAGAYGDALAGETDAASLENVISRNIYGVEAAAPSSALAAYVRTAAASFAAQPDGRLMAGVAAFPPAPAQAGLNREAAP